MLKSVEELFAGEVSEKLFGVDIFGGGEIELSKGGMEV